MKISIYLLSYHVVHLEYRYPTTGLYSAEEEKKVEGGFNTDEFEVQKDERQATTTRACGAKNFNYKFLSMRTM